MTLQLVGRKESLTFISLYSIQLKYHPIYYLRAETSLSIPCSEACGGNELVEEYNGSDETLTAQTVRIFCVLPKSIQCRKIC